MLDQEHIAPEYRELHAIYVRCAEITERLLVAGCASVGNPLFGELLGRCSGLGQDAAQLIAFLQGQCAQSPALQEAWRESLRL